MSTRNLIHFSYWSIGELRKIFLNGEVDYIPSRHRLKCLTASMVEVQSAMSHWISRICLNQYTPMIKWLSDKPAKLVCAQSLQNERRPLEVIWPTGATSAFHRSGDVVFGDPNTSAPVTASWSRWKTTFCNFILFFHNVHMIGILSKCCGDVTKTVPNDQYTWANIPTRTGS